MSERSRRTVSVAEAHQLIFEDEDLESPSSDSDGGLPSSEESELDDLLANGNSPEVSSSEFEFEEESDGFGHDDHDDISSDDDIPVTHGRGLFRGVYSFAWSKPKTRFFFETSFSFLFKDLTRERRAGSP